MVWVDDFHVLILHQAYQDQDQHQVAAAQSRSAEQQQQQHPIWHPAPMSPLDRCTIGHQSTVGVGVLNCPDTGTAPGVLAMW